MAHNAPGRHYREGITLMQLADMFPDEAAARTWFEGLVWPDGRYCPRCGSTRTHEASHAKSPCDPAAPIADPTSLSRQARWRKLQRFPCGSGYSLST